MLFLMEDMFRDVICYHVCSGYALVGRFLLWVCCE